MKKKFNFKNIPLAIIWIPITAVLIIAAPLALVINMCRGISPKETFESIAIAREIGKNEEEGL